MYKRIILLSLILLASCTPEASKIPSDYIKEGEKLINCVSKLDKSNILYYKSKATEYVPDSMPVKIWFIEDVKGVTHSLNNYEIENYVCSYITK